VPISLAGAGLWEALILATVLRSSCSSFALRSQGRPPLRTRRIAELDLMAAAGESLPQVTAAFAFGREQLIPSDTSPAETADEILTTLASYLQRISGTEH
jgi:hypothetical protein